MNQFYSEALGVQLTIQQQLGEGGSGQTHLVTDPDGNRYVLKILKLATADRWKIIERFQREIEVLKSLDHPGIPTYYDLIEHEDTMGILQEYIDGDTFREIIKGARLIDQGIAESLLKQGLDILRYLKNQDPPVIHRDIAPGNLILDKNSKVWLVDFGAARWQLEQSNTMTCMGTFGYMAPEQIYGQVSPKSDLYSFGVSLLAMLTRTEASDFPVDVESGFPDFKWGIERVPEEVRGILSGMTAPGVANRSARVRQPRAKKVETGVIKDQVLHTWKLGTAFHRILAILFIWMIGIPIGMGILHGITGGKTVGIIYMIGMLIGLPFNEFRHAEEEAELRVAGNHLRLNNYLNGQHFHLKELRQFKAINGSVCIELLNGDIYDLFKMSNSELYVQGLNQKLGYVKG